MEIDAVFACLGGSCVWACGSAMAPKTRNYRGHFFESKKWNNTLQAKKWLCFSDFNLSVGCFGIDAEMVDPKMHEMVSDRSSRAENWTDLRKMSMRVFFGSNISRKKDKNKEQHFNIIENPPQHIYILKKWIYLM